MKKIILLFGMCLVLLSSGMMGCGILENMYDNVNYESLSDERGDIKIISGGKTVFEFQNIKIKYSNADTQAMFFTTSDGKDMYWQDGLLMEIK